MTEKSPIDDLTNDLVENMPEPQEHAIEQEAQTATGQTQEDTIPQGTVASGPRDADGNSFDPQRHQVDAEGNPKLTATGKLRKKRKSPKSTVAHAEPPVQSSNTDSRMAATATVEAIGMAGRMLGGEEWAFIRSVEHGVDEKAAGIDAFTSYYNAKGITDVPPGVLLAIWGLSYAGPRFAMPKTKSRVRIAFEWARSKLSRKRYARKEPEDE
jgi:hypothetical protein